MFLEHHFADVADTGAFGQNEALEGCFEGFHGHVSSPMVLRNQAKGSRCCGGSWG
jgi:hypothetical protein